MLRFFFVVASPREATFFYGKDIYLNDFIELQ